METLCSLPIILTLLVIIYLIEKTFHREIQEGQQADDDELLEDIVMLDMIDDEWQDDRETQ
ncbi:MAG: hypothetical protein GYA15_09780 [Leptolinea sp.]|jgi:hypothetical protein|nr:hypothetical protein [Leptolinea sp.]